MTKSINGANRTFTAVGGSGDFESSEKDGPGNSFFYETSFQDGTPGDPITDFVTTFNTVYSTAITGPDGSSQVAKTEPAFEAKFHSGNMVAVDYGEGDEIWVAWYEYFPNGFIFANGVNGDSGGGAGNLKWLRLQYVGNSERITLQIDATPAWTSGEAIDYMQPDGIEGELMDWVNRYGNQKIFYDNETTIKTNTGVWHQVQMNIKLSTGDVNTADGDGRIRVWVGETFVGEDLRNTMPQNGNNLKSIWLGDYWNGGAPVTQPWYFDVIRMADTAPTTTDSGGRPYIAPIV